MTQKEIYKNISNGLYENKDSELFIENCVSYVMNENPSMGEASAKEVVDNARKNSHNNYLGCFEALNRLVYE